MTRRRINVLFMQSQTYYGADSMIHRLLMEHLDRDDFTVHVACNAGEDGTGSPALDVLRTLEDAHVRPTAFGPTANSRSRGEVLRSALSRGPQAAVDLARLAVYARRRHIDVVHATEKPRDAFYGLLLSRAIGASCVVHLHVKAEDWISPLSRWAMGHADGLVGVSDFVSDSIVDLGYDPARVHTVLNALDPTGWEPTPPDPSVRAEFGVPADVPLVVTASRLFPWKGQGDLLRALADVRRSGRRFHLLVVGEDDPRATPGGGSYLAQLRGLTTELGLDDTVTFTGYRTDVRRLMSAGDVFAMPSFEEPFGVVYVEAMALGKPVVGLDNGGTREVVDHGVTGLLSAPADVAALAADLGRLLDDAGLRRRMGAAGRERLLRHFTPGRMADDMAAIYRSLVHGRRPAARAVQHRTPDASSILMTNHGFRTLY